MSSANLIETKAGWTSDVGEEFYKDEWVDTLEEYGNEAISLATYPEVYGPIYVALKLTGEAGEYSDKLGKWFRGDYEEFPREALALELGDVLWYVNACAYELGYTLGQIANMNLEKLQSRAHRNVLKGDGDDR